MTAIFAGSCTVPEMTVRVRFPAPLHVRKPRSGPMVPSGLPCVQRTGTRPAMNVPLARLGGRSAALVGRLRLRLLGFRRAALTACSIASASRDRLPRWRVDKSTRQIAATVAGSLTSLFNVPRHTVRPLLPVKTNASAARPTWLLMCCLSAGATELGSATIRTPGRDVGLPTASNDDKARAASLWKHPPSNPSDVATTNEHR